MSLGDPEHPISFRFEPRVEGAHVKVYVRAGLAGMRAFAGELSLRKEEWAALVEVLGRSVDDGKLAATLRESIPMGLRENPEGLDYHARVLLATQSGVGTEHVRLVHVAEDPIEIDAIVSDPYRDESDDFSRGYAAGLDAGRAEGRLG